MHRRAGHPSAFSCSASGRCPDRRRQACAPHNARVNAPPPSLNADTRADVGASKRPTLQVSVLMRRVRNQGVAARWKPWRWVLDEVLPQQPQHGTAPRRLYDNESGECWIFPGHRVTLFKDDAEGYYLNASTPAPGWFVLWRMHEAADGGEPMPQPEAVSLSYHDAGRWLDAQETVEQVPAPPEVVEWLRAFAQAHYQPETRRRQRPQSFRPLTDRFGNPARVSTQEKRRGGGGG